MNGLLPEESLSDDLFGDFFNFPLQDIDDDDTTNGEEGDWDAKFQNLEPPMDVFTSFPSEFTSSCGINELGRVGTVPGVKQGAALTGINSTVHQSSSPHDIKISKVFQSLSPLSVLESSDSSFSPPQRMTSPVKGLRSKRKRPPTPRCKNLNPFEPGKPEKSTPGGESGLKTYYAFGQHGKNKRKVLQSKVARKCTHCETTETPQWREGPNGPKTLCNACGVRFKSGRLVPEYRPASSPTFIPSVHSNSHRKIIEMRRKEGGQFHTSMTHGVISRA